MDELARGPDLRSVHPLVQCKTLEWRRGGDIAFGHRTLGENALNAASTFPKLSSCPRRSLLPERAIESTAVGESEQSEFVSIKLDAVEWLIAGNANVDDLLRPGIAEWGLLKAEGGGLVVPSAAVIENGEGDLRRADSVEIRRALLPVDVEFVSSDDWSQQHQFAGSSTIGLLLLALLGLFLAAEQSLAYWASYHTRAVAPDDASSGNEIRRPTFGLNVKGGHAS